MTRIRSLLLLTVICVSLANVSQGAEPPKPYGPLPSRAQLLWHDMEFYGFLHFTVNTFTDKEWGYGDEPESVFNPTAFDAEQIVGTAKQAGMKGLILTAKHHDGFCLWPSKYTEHSVKNSPWKGGKGDVVREISDACRRQGLKFGVYLSPWDRNHKDYGRPEYVTYYRNQLRELLSEYGPIFEVWFDGANGGDGYYGGAREKRQIDRKTYYGWPETWALVRQFEPDAVMFSDAGPDVRWVGNERGVAGDPCWATVNSDDWCPGFADKNQLNAGLREGMHWLPAECDVSIRPGWFYHASQDTKVRTPENVVQLYFASVGRGANLLLNLPPDRRGLIYDNDVATLQAVRKHLDATFAKDLAAGAKLAASNVRGGDTQFGPEKLIDGDKTTYWSTDDVVTTAEVVLDLGRPVTFNVVRLREAIQLGQRIGRFGLDAWQDGQWVSLAEAESIGAQRLVRTEPITTPKVRLRITKAAACPAIAELGLFFEPPLTPAAKPPDARLVRAATTATAGGLYPFNRPPLKPTMLLKLPVGSVTPRGWLRNQLLLEADGMAGHLNELSRFLKFDDNGWADPRVRGGWEELPYWLKGYGDLGYVLRDEKIIREARKWIDAILASQEPDGWFGPQGLKSSLKGKPDMWPHMPVLNTLQSYYEFSGDERVPPFMLKYFCWQNSLPGENFAAGYWPRMRAGDNLESIYWLYNRLGESWLLDLARKIHENMADWTNGLPNWHNVNISQCFREPAEYWLQAQAPALLDAAEGNYRQVMDLYGQFPGGGFAGDENCRPGYGDPRQGFETCGIVEFMHSFEMLTRISGNPLWADRCEEIAMNSLPAALTPDQKALHYLTGANLIQLDRQNKSPSVQNRGMMLAYSPHAYRCCQHNHAMGWPYYAEELWLATANKGLCASLYAASEVTAKVGDGVETKVTEETDYPFNGTIRLQISPHKPVAFPLYLRVPRWCDRPLLKLNGNDLDVTAAGPSYVAVERVWAAGDIVTLQLPMQIRLRTWKANKNSVSVDYGPLTFSLKIGEEWVCSGGTDAWPEWEVFPTTPWNYGLLLADGDPARSFKLVRRKGPLADQPFTPQTAPIELHARAKRIPGWQQDALGLVGLLQQSPARSEEPEETITLIPMGAARLRIASFPTVSSNPDAHDWVAPPKPHPSPFKPSASHVFRNDTVEAICDGLEPSSSNDHSLPRFTWWDHKGTREWVQYDFEKPRRCTAVSVYWFDDTSRGHCRVPASWKLLYKDGDQWRPVTATLPYGTKLNAYNRLTLTPVETSALRIEVELQPGCSGGILEWKVE